MILMGDEVRRTQGGNNNAYCQDDESSWLDWTLIERHADMHRFVSILRVPPAPRHRRRRIDDEPQSAPGASDDPVERRRCTNRLGRALAPWRSRWRVCAGAFSST